MSAADITPELRAALVRHGFKPMRYRASEGLFVPYPGDPWTFSTMPDGGFDHLVTKWAGPIGHVSIGLDVAGRHPRVLFYAVDPKFFDQ